MNEAVRAALTTLADELGIPMDNRREVFWNGVDDGIKQGPELSSGMSYDDLDKQAIYDAGTHFGAGIWAVNTNFAAMTFDRDEFHDYVVTHGYGAPTEEGYKVGLELFNTGDDYSAAAFEIVSRGLTVDSQ